MTRSPVFKREERPPAHELHHPRPPAGRRVAREDGVLIIALERVLHEVGDLRVARVVVDGDVGRGHVEVLVDAEGHLLADDCARLVDGRVQEVDVAARRIERELRVDRRRRRRWRRLVEAIEPGYQHLPRIERRHPEGALLHLRGPRATRRRLTGGDDVERERLSREARTTERDGGRTHGERADALRLERPFDRERVTVRPVAVDDDVRLRRRLVLAPYCEPGRRSQRAGVRHAVGARGAHHDGHGVADADRVLVELLLDLRRALRRSHRRPQDRRRARPQDRQRDPPQPRAAASQAHLSAIPRTRFLPARLASSCWSVGAFSSWSSIRWSSSVLGGGGAPASRGGSGPASGGRRRRLGVLPAVLAAVGCAAVGISPRGVLAALAPTVGVARGVGARVPRRRCVGPGVLLVVDPAEGDRAVERRVPSDRIPAVGLARRKDEGAVVCASRRLRSRRRGRRGCPRDSGPARAASPGTASSSAIACATRRAHSICAWRFARIASVTPSVDLLFAEPAPVLLADAKEREAQVEGPVGPALQELRRPDDPVLARAGREVVLEAARGRRGVSGVEVADGLLHQGRVAIERARRIPGAAARPTRARAARRPPGPRARSPGAGAFGGRSCSHPRYAPSATRRLADQRVER